MTDEEKNDKELSETVKAIEETQKNLEKLSENKEAREIAWLREKYEMDKKFIEASGYSKGSKDEKINIAKKMLEDGMEIELICRYTGLNKDEID